MANDYMNRKDQMFPKLTPAQIARVANIGTRRDVRAGEVLFAPGEQNTSFFVVVRGEIAISRPHGDKEEVIVTHGPGEFTGEINMLSARRSLALGAQRRPTARSSPSTARTCTRWCRATPS